MRIEAQTVFKHGRVKLEKGGLYDVPERFGGYFVGMGWAKDYAGDKPCETITAEQFASEAPKEARVSDTLEVQDAQLGTSSPNVE